MNKIIKWLQLGISATGGLIGTFLGGFDGIVYAMILFVIIDYITGLLAAIKIKELHSGVGFWGIVKKIMLFILVGVANTIDLHLIGRGATLRTTVIFFFITNEGLSIIENAAALGVPIPNKLKDVLNELGNTDK